jgi:hypothetical protein
VFGFPLKTMRHTVALAELSALPSLVSALDSCADG